MNVAGDAVTEDRVRAFAREYGEPEWVTRRRLRALELLRDHAPLPGGLVAVETPAAAESLKAPEEAAGEGRGAVDESEAAYAEVLGEITARGVVMVPMAEALRGNDLAAKWFGSLVPAEEGAAAALNAAVWSQGVFLYVPPGVEVEVPLQSEFLGFSEGELEFGRHLIVADRGSRVHFIEGCSAPVRTRRVLRAGVAEVVALPGARVRYTALQNLSRNVLNLSRKRAYVDEGASVEWVTMLLGSRLTRSVPGAILAGRGARVSVEAMAVASRGQEMEIGGEAEHRGPEGESTIHVRCIARDGGCVTHASSVRVQRGASQGRAAVRAETLLLDDRSTAEAEPVVEIRDADASVSQEGGARRLDEDQVFYLTSRGLSRAEAAHLLLTSFLGLGRHLPPEYAVEFDRFVDEELRGAFG